MYSSNSNYLIYGRSGGNPEVSPGRAPQMSHATNRGLNYNFLCGTLYGVSRIKDNLVLFPRFQMSSIMDQNYLFKYSGFI